MSTSPFNFADLTTPEGRDVIRQRLVDNLLADGQPTSSWAASAVGGVENLRADMLAAGLADLVATRVAGLAAGRILPTATDSPETGYFLSFLGLKFFGLTKRPASKTIQNVQLSMSVTGNQQTFSDGDLIVQSPSTGNRYRLVVPEGQTVQLGPGDTVNASFEAENAGSSYSDAEGTITRMVTAKAGVTCVNFAAAQFTPPRSTGNSSGKLAPSVVGVRPSYSALRVRIDATGNIGAGLWSYSIDGGLTWTSGGVIPNSRILHAGGDVRVTFIAGASPSFLQGSIFTMRVGQPIVRQGSDGDTDDFFRLMCSNRHAAIGLVPCKSHLELWSWRASSEPTRFLVQGDPNRSGGVLLTIASAVGPASPNECDLVEDYIRPRLQGFKGVPAPTSPAVAGSGSPEESILVTSAPSLVIAAGGTVYVPVDQLAAAQAGADAPWNAYLRGVPMGGQPGAVVQLEDLYTLLGDLGAVDVQGLKLNGVAADVTLPVATVAVPFPGLTLANGLSWVAA